MDEEMHRADPKFRHAAPWWLLATIVAGSAGIWALHLWLQAPSTVSSFDALQGMMMVAAGLVVLLATVSLGLAHALWREATRIRQEDRFPPSDMRTLRDVAVRHGAAARRIAGGMRIGAIVAALAGAGILVWGYRLLRLLA